MAWAEFDGYRKRQTPWVMWREQLTYQPVAYNIYIWIDVSNLSNYQIQVSVELWAVNWIQMDGTPN